MNFLKLRFAELSEWFLDRAHATMSVSIIRVTVGLLGLAYYLVEYGNRSFLFGPGGLYGHDRLRDSLADARSWSIYLLSDSPVYFEILFHIGILLTAAVMFGVGGRPLLLLHYVFIWSLYMTNPSLLDGGDNLIMIIVPFLLLTRCYDYFVVLHLRPKDRRSAWRSGRNLFNNVGVLLIAGQISIVYLMAGLYKVQGQLWQDGTALYYILRTPEFFFPGVTPILFQFDWLLVLATYGTVLMSVFFPILVLFPQGRPIAVALMAAFHLGIAVLMGLTSFALIMIACDMIFIDSYLRKGLGRAVAVVRRFWPRHIRSDRATADNPDAVLARERLTS